MDIISSIFILKVILFLYGGLSCVFLYFLIREYRKYIKTQNYNEDTNFTKIIMFILVAITFCALMFIIIFSVFVLFSKISIGIT